jgi:hypothetical protein
MQGFGLATQALTKQVLYCLSQHLQSIFTHVLEMRFCELLFRLASNHDFSGSQPPT